MTSSMRPLRSGPIFALRLFLASAAAPALAGPAAPPPGPVEIGPVAMPPTSWWLSAPCWRTTDLLAVLRRDETFHREIVLDFPDGRRIETWSGDTGWVVLRIGGLTACVVAGGSGQPT